MPVLRQAGLLVVAYVLQAGGAAAQDDPGTVSHQLSFPEIRQQYVRVISEFPVSGSEATLIMANWTPGSYLIREFAANLDRIEAREPGGNPLSLNKIRKNAWRVQLQGSQRLVVEYDVHAGELTVNTSWASPEFVLINGASVFLYTDETRGLPQEISVQVPPGSGRVLTPLPEAGAPGRWRAMDFDELVDSPLVVTSNAQSSFRQDGHGFRLVNIGDASLWDNEQAAEDVHGIVTAANDFWEAVPLRRDYWFFNFLVEKSGGLEHDHSTVLMTSRWQMRKREDYIKWLSLVAHEYFHSWNLRRMRPASIAEYDYENEQYSSALWLAEGISSYYDNLLLSRAKLVSLEEYFKQLAIDIHRLELTPGRRLISLEEASRDTWIRHYRPDANSINSEISYYTKGAVVGFVLDARIRRETKGRSSLDDVMRHMWQAWGSQPYPDSAFRDAVEAIGGREIRDWLEPLLSTTQDPDIDGALDWYGLELDRHPEHTAAVAAGNPLTAGFGVNWDRNAAGLVVSSVVKGLAGADAGILPGDEVLAIDSERINRDTLEDRMQRLEPGQSAELLIARRGRVMTLTTQLAEARPATFEIRLQPNIGKRQIRRLGNWLGQELQAVSN